MERAFQRAFASANQSSAAAEICDTSPSTAADAPAEEVTDPVQQILKAVETKDYFRLLGLPEPEADELGRPMWSCTDNEISKAYRKLSVAVHPDKNPGENARQAFEALNKIYRLLKDPGAREEVLRGAAEKARQRREQREVTGDIYERVQLLAAKNQRSRQLRKQEGDSLQAGIVQQLRMKQAEAARKVAQKTLAPKQTANSRSLWDHSAKDDDPHNRRGNDDDDDDAGPTARSYKRKRPTFI